MLDIGWSEMLVIGIVALVVLGPKELPNALRTFAYWMRQARNLAREFHSGVDQLVREAELDEAKKTLQAATSLNINREIEKAIDPDRDIAKALAPPSLRDAEKPATTTGPKPGVPTEAPQIASSPSNGLSHTPPSNGAGPEAEAPAAPSVVASPSPETDAQIGKTVGNA